MNELRSCRLTDSVVQSYFDAKTPELASLTLDHLRTCTICSERLDELLRDDLLVQGLASSHHFEASAEDEEAIERLIENGRELAESRSSEDTQFLGELSTPAIVPNRIVVDEDALTEWLRQSKPTSPFSLGRLRLLSILGKGGMGIVVKAWDTALERHVAAKILEPEIAHEEGRALFLREARAMAKVDHENVIEIHDIVTDSPLPFFVMKLLEGSTLHRRLHSEGTLSPLETIDLGIEVGLGLEAAHAEGLIHRDIKPSNIWLDSEKKGKVVLLDFGLVHNPAQANPTDGSRVVGTPQYMAPEQVEGSPLDHRCDLFSLGCVLYRCLVGRLPFDGESTKSQLASRLAVDVPSLDANHTNIPEPLSNVLARLLRRNPEERYGSAHEVIEALRVARVEIDPNRSATSTAREALTIEREENTVLDAATPEVRLSRSASTSSSSPWLKRAGWLGLVASVALVVFGLVLAQVNKPKNEPEPGAIKKLQFEKWLLAHAATGEFGKSNPLYPAYLDKTHLPLVQVLGDSRLHHWASVLDANYTSDGKFVATVGLDGVRVWETREHREVSRILWARSQFEKLGRKPYAFSPDGKLIAIENKGTEIELYPVRVQRGPNLQPTQTIRQTLVDEVAALALHPKGQLLAIGGRDGKVGIWDRRSKSVWKTLQPKSMPIVSLRFSPDGKWLIVVAEGSIDGESNTELTLVEATKNGNEHKWANPAEAGVNRSRSTILPDGKTLVRMTCPPATIRFFDLKTRKSILNEIQGRGATIGSFELLSNNRAISHGYGVTQLYSRHEERWAPSCELTNAQGGVGISSDRKHLISALAIGRAKERNNYHSLMTWELGSDTELQRQDKYAKPRYPTIVSASLSGDDRFLLTGASDGKVILRKRTGNRFEPVHEFDVRNYPKAIEIASDNRTVAVIHESVSFIDVKTKKRIDSPKELGNVQHGRFLTGGREFLYVNTNSAPRIWNLEKRLSRAWGHDEQWNIKAVAVHASRGLFACVNGYSLEVYDLNKPNSALWTAKLEYVNWADLDFDSSGNTLACTNGRHATLFDVKTGQARKKIHTNTDGGPICRQLDLSDDGKVLAMTNFYAGCHLYDTATEKVMNWVKLSPHQLEGSVVPILSHDGTLYITLNTNGTVYVYDRTKTVKK